MNVAALTVFEPAVPKRADGLQKVDVWKSHMPYSP